MVIAPKTLLAHWVRELAVCGVGKQTHEFFGSESERWVMPGRVAQDSHPPTETMAEPLLVENKRGARQLQTGLRCRLGLQ